MALSPSFPPRVTHARGARVGALPLTSALACARVVGAGVVLVVLPAPRALRVGAARLRPVNIDNRSVAIARMGMKIRVGGRMVCLLLNKQYTMRP